MADWQSTGQPTMSGSADVLVPSVNSKRQRRPSVRLGEIGDQSAAYSHGIRRKKQWKYEFQPPSGFSKNASDFLCGFGKSSKTRPLVNIGNENNDEQAILENPTSPQFNSGVADEGHLQGVNGKKMQLNTTFVSKKGRHGRTRRRGAGLVGRITRTMRVSPETNGNEKGSGDDGFGASYDIDTPEALKDSDLETSGSPVKEACTIHLDSPDSRPVNFGPSEYQQTVGEVSGTERGDKSEETWALNNKEQQTLSSEYRSGNGLDVPSDADTRSKHDANGILIRERNSDVDEKLVSVPTRHYSGLTNSIRTWLNGLGLGRYAQLFEMHEVDNEVLPLLTLDDLREMGINAVGPRRKMYTAIQKLGKSFAA
eukprot:Gb_25948 [translate_table: standard]